MRGIITLRVTYDQKIEVRGDNELELDRIGANEIKSFIANEKADCSDMIDFDFVDVRFVKKEIISD
jgi:hypothetical protein